MTGSTLSRDVCCRLASYIEARRSDIVASVVRSTVPTQPGAPTASEFAHAFVDRLSQELDVGDQDAIDVWVDGQAVSVDAPEYARIVNAVCTTISAKYTSECGDSDGVIRYFSSRSSQLEKRFGVERAAMPANVFDLTKAVNRNDIVASLLAAIDLRDPATCDHSRAVGLWCGRLAKTIGMDAEEQAFAILAGTLHDVGKVTTPTEILRKAGPLSVDEWETMRSHARVGGKMLERIPLLCDVAPVVRWHHERIDGNGYPDGLVGDEIPMLARIVAVADSFHAMISKRPYRKSLPVLVALDEIRAGAGTQWDREVIGAMLSIVQPAGAVRRLRAVQSVSSA